MIRFMVSSKEPINPKDIGCIKTMLKSGILQNTFPSMHDGKENQAAKIQAYDTWGKEIKRTMNRQ